MMLTAETAREIWEYDLESGDFRWKISPRYKVEEGSIAGSFDGKYWRLQWKGRIYKRSRVAWLYVTGSWPTDQIDHIDGNRRNDAFSNLREASNMQNCCNRGIRKNNKIGIKGIHKTRYGFVAQVAFSGKKVFCKHYKSLEQAKAAYEAAVLEHHGNYARI